MCARASFTECAAVVCHGKPRRETLTYRLLPVDPPPFSGPPRIRVSRSADLHPVSGPPGWGRSSIPASGRAMCH